MREKVKVVINSDSCYDNRGIISMSAMLSPQELKELYPLSRSEEAFVAHARRECQSILDQKDPRLAIICGPCSIHNVESALKYATLLKGLSQQVSSHYYLLMRVYIEKPRTCLGWKGLLYQPDLSSKSDLLQGIKLSRELFREIVKLELPIATEILDPLVFPYFDDLISWGFIGSRTSASQIHRQIASVCPFPVGFKNATDGSLEPAINGMRFAKEAQTFFGIDQSGKVESVTSEGNPYAHLVLRGSDEGPNCSLDSLKRAHALLKLSSSRTSLIVDCSHGNSGKDFRLQPRNFETLTTLAHTHPHLISGLMLESHLKGASQLFSDRDLDPEISITDSCIDWPTTESLLTRQCESLQTRAWASIPS